MKGTSSYKFEIPHRHPPGKSSTHLILSERDPTWSLYDIMAVRWSTSWLNLTNSKHYFSLVSFFIWSNMAAMSFGISFSWNWGWYYLFICAMPTPERIWHSSITWLHWETVVFLLMLILFSFQVKHKNHVACEDIWHNKAASIVGPIIMALDRMFLTWQLCHSQFTVCIIASVCQHCFHREPDG